MIVCIHRNHRLDCLHQERIFLLQTLHILQQAKVLRQMMHKKSKQWTGSVLAW